MRTEPTPLDWRPARAEDRARSETILRAAFAEYARKAGYQLGRDAYDWLPEAIGCGRVCLAVRDDTIVGVVVTSRQPDSWDLEFIAVPPHGQGKGLGTWMLQRIEDDARRQGIARMTLHTAKMMHRLVSLYARHGYRVVREGPPPHGRDTRLRVYMEKALR